MRIKDIIESVHLSHYETDLEQMLKNGITDSIGKLYEVKGSWPKAEKSFAKGEFKHLFDALDTQLEDNLKDLIASNLRKGLKDQFGIKLIHFEDMERTVNAYVQDSVIAINNKWAKRITKDAMEIIETIVLDNYGEEEYLGGLWFTLKSIGTRDTELMRTIFSYRSDLEPRISTLTSTLVHELVHVVQDKRQQHRGDTEYRSYLDSFKDEFSDMHDRRMAGEKEPGDDESYWRLYLASPQEIPAFSHQFALRLVRDTNLKDATSLDEFDELIQTVDAKMILDAIRSSLRGRFENPENKREYAILKKYIKATYLEFTNYAERLRSKLEDSLDKHD